MATTAEQLILRGLHLILRTTFTPNDQVLQAKHLVALQHDIGPWMTDYAVEIEKPAVDFMPVVDPASGGYDGGPINQH